MCVADALKYLTRSDWERVIDEAALGEENTKIAKMYLLDWKPHIEIAVEMNLDRKTVSRRLLRIMDKVEHTARKLYS